MQIGRGRGRLCALIVLGINALTLTRIAEARDLKIFGTPPRTALAGRAYTFTPSTMGNPGRRMTFSIANKPAWAKFNPHNGGLSGTPAGGVYSRITISVTDGSSRSALPSFNINVTKTAAASNRAPTINGSAPLRVEAGKAYSFMPKAADSDGDTLRFSISSKPAWASFDPATGRLWGVPTSQQAGSYEEIQIAVTDGKSTVRLPAFAINVAEGAAVANRNVTLSWQPPAQNTDGSALTNLAGYTILYGAQPKNYTGNIKLANAGLTRYLVENLPPGKYYFVMVAFNSHGEESERSAEATIELQ